MFFKYMLLIVKVCSVKYVILIVKVRSFKYVVKLLTFGNNLKVWEDVRILCHCMLFFFVTTNPKNFEIYFCLKCRYFENHTWTRPLPWLYVQRQLHVLERTEAKVTELKQCFLKHDTIHVIWHSRKMYIIIKLC